MTNLIQRFVNLATGEVTADVNNTATTTENLGLGDVTGDGIPAQAIEHGKVWADDGKLYDQPGTAIDNATDVVIIGPGTFSSFAKSVAGLAIFGCGEATVIAGGSGTAVSLQADDMEIHNIAVKSTAGGGNSARGLQLQSSRQVATGIRVLESDEDGVRLIGATECRVIGVHCDSANIDGTDVDIESNADNNVIDDVIGTVSDGGTGNSVGETA